MRTKFIYFAFVLLICFERAQSQGGIVAVATGGALVKDILSKFMSDAQQMLNQANSDGNALVSRVGNEITVAVQNANLLLEKDMNKAFNKLSDQSSRILTSIDQMRMTALDVVKTAYNLKDATVLDLRRILGDYLPVKKTMFYVQRVDGITQLVTQGAKYTFNIEGIGFGFDANNFKSAVSGMTVNGQAIKDFSETKIAANNSTVSVPSAAVNGILNNDTTITQIKIAIGVRVSAQTGLFKKWETKNFSLPLTVSIIPATMKTFTVDYTMPDFNWVTVTDPIVYSYTTPDHDQHDKRHDDIHSYNYNSEYKVPANQRYINARIIKADGAGCPWTKCNFVHCDEQNNTVIHANFDTWGLPCTYSFGATLQQYQQTGTSGRPSIQINGVRYGGNLVVTIPNTSKYWTIKGSTVDLNPIDIVQQGSFSTLIVFQNVVDDGVNFKIIYKVGYPL